MAKRDFLRTRYEWLAALSSESAVIRELRVEQTVADAVYKAEGEKFSANGDAFNLSNSPEHNDAVIQTIHSLEERGVSKDTLKKIIVDLTSQNTYGTFSELSAYRFLLKGGQEFDIQAPIDGGSILNANGSDLDGVIRLPEAIFFDVKGFGFIDHLVKRLTDRLSRDVDPENVVAQRSWDVSADLLTDLLGKNYKALLKELLEKRKALRDSIELSVRAPERIQFTEREIDPVRAARENSEYVFRFAKQFVRSEPFILIFVLHPWFSGSLHVNFDGALDTFTGEFATQAFCRFEQDAEPIFGITRAEAARLLSGIIFIDAWEGPRSSAGARYRLFLNPNASNKPNKASVAAFAASYGHDMCVREVRCA